MTVSGKLQADTEIHSPADLFHDVFSGRPHHTSIMSPEKIQGVDLHVGDWGKPGTVICWNYTHDGVAKVAKEVIEAIDDVNLSTTFKVIEGDLLKVYKSFRFIVQATPKGSGSLVHWTLEYEKPNIDTPEPFTLLEFVVHLSKDVAAHLIKEQK